MILWFAKNSPPNCNVIAHASGKAGVNGYLFVDEKFDVRVVVMEKLMTDRSADGKDHSYRPKWLNFLRHQMTDPDQNC